VLFSIERGHDGPARVAKLKIGSFELDTPILTGPSESDTTIHYMTLGRDESLRLKGPVIYSIPSPLNFDATQLAIPNDNSLILLPSIPSFTRISDDAPYSVLEYQKQFLSHMREIFDPARAIVRLPNVQLSERFENLVSELSDLGVQNAAITINGLGGDPDLMSLGLRSIIPRNWMVIALGMIPPSMLPVLYYTGIDLFDIGYAIERATQSIRLWSLTEELIEKEHTPRFCRCASCTLGINDPENSRTDLVKRLTSHNVALYQEILSESVDMMRRGNLRWLVESFTHSSPSNAAFLRNIDSHFYHFLEEFTPSTGFGPRPLIGPESYHAPMVRRFREFVASRFQPPPSKQLVLLFPCSARKPYSDSKSHRRFNEVIERALGLTRNHVAETILTSPLGVVPRELERMYPAASYDIPVTGVWDHEEVSIAADALMTHMNKFDKSCVVVAHVGGGYRDIVQAAQERISQSVIYTSEDISPGKRDALHSLKEVLIDLREKFSLTPKKSTLVLDTLRATADYQFGLGAGQLLIPDAAHLKGKIYRMVLVNLDRTQLCAFVSDQGVLSLTIDGAKLLAPLQRYWVRFKGSEVKGGSLFAIGVDEADPNIRPGDEVYILDMDNQVIAVGRSEMSGQEMCHQQRGRAVTLRHKVGDKK
jgi:archaeosine synthase